MNTSDHQINCEISNKIINIENITITIIKIRSQRSFFLKLPAAKFIATIQNIMDKIWIAEKFCIHSGKLLKKVSFVSPSLIKPYLHPIVIHIKNRIRAGRKKSTARPAEDFLDTLDLVDIPFIFDYTKSS